MMKKVVTLVLVLSLVSIASATPTITGPSEINGAGTYTYTVVGVAENYKGGVFADLAIHGYYPGGLPTGITSINAGTSAPLQTTGSKYRMGDVDGGFATIGTYYYGIKFEASSGSVPANTPVIAGDWFTLDVVVNSGVAATGSMELDISTSAWTCSGNALTVDFVPEPATMALLGLGGLLLRKRK